MTKDELMVFYSLAQSIRYEIRAIDPTLTEEQRKHWRNSADDFAKLLMNTAKARR